MKCSASLLGMNVGDYFNLCNWQLLPLPNNNYLPKQAKTTAPQRPIVLSTLTVKEFLSSCNWQLLPQNESAVKITSPSPFLPSPSSNLPRLTVAEFFSLCNWQSLSLEVYPLQSSLLEPKSLLAWQVKAFFQSIPWESNAEIGATKALERSPLISPALGEINLNDLSNLF